MGLKTAGVTESLLRRNVTHIVATQPCPMGQMQMGYEIVQVHKARHKLSSQFSLSYSTVSNNPRISVAFNNIGLFLAHITYHFGLRKQLTVSKKIFANLERVQYLEYIQSSYNSIIKRQLTQFGNV